MPTPSSSRTISSVAGGLTRERMAGLTPRPDVRENAPQFGNLLADFDFNQQPRPPLILPTHPPSAQTPAERCSRSTGPPTAGERSGTFAWRGELIAARVLPPLVVNRLCLLQEGGLGLAQW